jgi:hypothetical protein
VQRAKPSFYKLLFESVACPVSDILTIVQSEGDYSSLWFLRDRLTERWGVP